MKKTFNMPFAAAVLLQLSLVAGCAIPKKSPEPAIDNDINRVVTVADGTTCVEPAGLAASRQMPGAGALRELIESEGKADEALTRAKALKIKPDEAEAVYFDACRSYSNGAIKKEAFEKYRTVYSGMRQQFVAQGVKEWQDKKEGIGDPGKLCLIGLSDQDPDHRSFTRVIPADSTVNDCAQLAIANGSKEILLGCTKGHWDNTWAKQPTALVPDGSKLKQLTAKGTPRAPDPDCGWD
jgi:hypothetical protein